MPLLAFWASNRSAVEELSVEQVLSSAGDGVLKDSSVCSQEFRTYLSQVPSGKIATYVDHCISSAFNRSGLALQDLVNELGRRLDYTVTNGRYQGAPSAIGFDGTWVSPEGHTIVVEVKTTDAYRISLDTIAGYREKLLTSDAINGSSSILVVVGRADTGELEAQVRGSRHAWDIRLIGVDSLIKLVQLKENADGRETGQKIRSLIKPMEYTRLDEVIDVVFTTATDVETTEMSDTFLEETDQDTIRPLKKSKSAWEFTESNLLQTKREDIVRRFGAARGLVLIKKSRALYWDANHQNRLVCTISKRYASRPTYPYWYAYHPQWDEFLAGGQDSFLIFGCMDLPFSFEVPWRVFHDCLDALNTTTTKDDHTYWHVHITEPVPGQYAVLLPKGSTSLSLNAYTTKPTE